MPTCRRSARSGSSAIRIAACLSRMAASVCSILARHTGSAFNSAKNSPAVFLDRLGTSCLTRYCLMSPIGDFTSAEARGRRNVVSCAAIPEKSSRNLSERFVPHEHDLGVCQPENREGKFTTGGAWWRRAARLGGYRSAERAAILVLESLLGSKRIRGLHAAIPANLVINYC